MRARIVGPAALTRREPESAWVTAAVALGLCSLRRGEVFGLTWGDVDLEGGRVRVRQSLKAPDKGERVLEAPKSKAARREIGLPSWARAALRAHREKLPAIPHPALLVFTTATGEPMHFSDSTRRHFRPLAKRAEIPWATYHSLRHTFATLLLGFVVTRARAARAYLPAGRPNSTFGFLRDGARRSLADRARVSKRGVSSPNARPTPGQCAAQARLTFPGGPGTERRAPPQNRKKQWPDEAQMEGWFSRSREEQRRYENAQHRD